jgi:NitT/TauT family transport system ATP-binding protein
MTPAYTLEETLLRVEGVSKSYGAEPVLRDVNLEIKNIVRPGMTQGQVVGLLGPSGMGKTTLFRILAGLEEPDEGRVLITEQGIPVKRGMVGVVAQHYPLFAHRRVLGNLAVAARRAGFSSREARSRSLEMLERFDMGPHASKWPAQLSGGQRQRVAIAQQFMCSEHFLLMDEPFSGLDLIAVDNVTRFICEVASSHELKTIIVVTHDIPAALEVADTIWLLGRDRDSSGKLIPGARVQATYDLAERGLAWRDGISTDPEFIDIMREIRSIFPRL